MKDRCLGISLRDDGMKSVVAGCPTRDEIPFPVCIT